MSHRRFAKLSHYTVYHIYLYRSPGVYFLLLGATVGFGIGSVNWSSIFGLSNSLSIQLKFVCGFSILITVLVALTLVTLCSIKEQLPQQDGEVEKGPSDTTSNNASINHDSQGDDKQATEEMSSLKTHKKY